MESPYMRSKPLLILIGICLVGIVACESFPKINELEWGAHKREFLVRADWVKDTLRKTNFTHRKINRMSPVLIGDMLIQANSIDGISAYRAKDGNLLWQVPIIGGVEGSANLIKDRLFFGANDGNFYSLDIRKGTIIWSYKTKSENFAQSYLDSENGVIYFLGGNNILYALEADSGKQLWVYSRQDTSGFSIRGGSRPLLYKDILFVGFSDGSFVAFNPKSGSPIWELSLNKNKRFRDIDSNILVDQESLFVAGYDDKLYSINWQKGEINWKIDGGSYSGPSIVDEKIYYPTSSGEIWALKKSTGEKLWVYKLKQGIATGIQIYKGLLVFGESQGSLRFLDMGTGKSVGSFEPGRGILSTPSVDEKNNRVYFISGEANLYSIEAKWRMRE